MPDRMLVTDRSINPVLIVVLALFGAACGAAGTSDAQSPVNAAPVTTPAPTTTSTTTTTTASPTTTSTTTTTSPATTTSTTTTTTSPATTAPTTTSPTTTIVVTPATTTTAPPPTTTSPSTTTTTVEPLPDATLPATHEAFERLARANRAAQMTVVRDGRTVFTAASGTTIEGSDASSDSPMVVASVSKLVTAITIARLEQAGALVVADPVPWADLGLTPHPAWNDVTVRELLDHHSGMPVVRSSWFGGSGDCASYLPTLVDSPPQAHRGQWRYSNGNYCALGLLVEQATGQPLDQAAQSLVFDPIGRDGLHLSVDGHRPSDVEYRLGTARLSRLGGAGTFIVSTYDLAAMAASVTFADLGVLLWPGVFNDQYGWGHTGTIDGAKSCVWSFESGRTVVAATVAGNSPSTGGGVCDVTVPAIASDLGLPVVRPDRTPP